MPNIGGAATEKEREKASRNQVPRPSEKLNKLKKSMAQLEWYMKFCEPSFYYDAYKKRSGMTDMDIDREVHKLNIHWSRKVLEAESKPQAPDARMRTRWLFSGITYMRIVEPLNIANHYRKPLQKSYLSVRDEHYKLLDKWNDEEAQRVPKKKKRKAPYLTEDSCFWAHVEDATLKLRELEKITAVGSDLELELKKELVKFEAYIMKLVNNYELSPDVFKEKTSFMEWWKKYDEVQEPGYYSPFVPLELPQGSQEHGELIRWWSNYNQQAEAVAGHCSNNHVRFWNGLGLSSDGFLNERNEFMAWWRDNEKRSLNPTDTSPFTSFMKGEYYRYYK